MNTTIQVVLVNIENLLIVLQMLTRIVGIRAGYMCVYFIFKVHSKKSFIFLSVYNCFKVYNMFLNTMIVFYVVLGYFIFPRGFSLIYFFRYT